MGRKINPILFRSNFKFKKTNWVTNINQYSAFLKEDKIIRKFIYSYFFNINLNINSIFLFRKQTCLATNYINSENTTLYIVLYLSRLVIKKIKYNKIFELKHLIKKQLLNKNLNINIKILNTSKKHKISERFNDLICKIEKGIPIKLVLSQFMKEVQQNKGIRGGKIEIKGRINGIEKARTIKSQYGAINLQKVYSKILFLNKQIHTADGILNIKFTYNLI